MTPGARPGELPGALPGGLPSVAAITMVRDEADMLPRWVAHYAAQVGVENLLVVDDNTTDGSTDHLPCPVLRIPPITKQAFEPARMGLLSGLAQALLSVHDAVVCSDADEFVVADPARHESLRHFVAARQDSTVLGVVGLNVVHLDGEPPLDPARPILEQRGHAKFVPLMCKPALTRIAAPWRWASHGIAAPYDVDPELFMFHMKFADRDLLRSASERRRRLVAADGRAATTSWRFGGEAMTAVLDQVSQAADPEAVRPFTVPREALRKVVQERPDGSWRCVGRGQLQSMQRRPLVAVPARFRGLV